MDSRRSDLVARAEFYSQIRRENCSADRPTSGELGVFGGLLLASYTYAGLEACRKKPVRFSGNQLHFPECLPFQASNDT
jgi:hypothetical protein